jgi:hypothetical protein
VLGRGAEEVAHGETSGGGWSEVEAVENRGARAARPVFTVVAEPGIFGSSELEDTVDKVTVTNMDTVRHELVEEVSPHFTQVCGFGSVKLVCRCLRWGKGRCSGVASCQSGANHPCQQTRSVAVGVQNEVEQGSCLAAEGTGAEVRP